MHSYRIVVSGLAAQQAPAHLATSTTIPAVPAQPRGTRKWKQARLPGGACEPRTSPPPRRGCILALLTLLLLVCAHPALALNNTFQAGTTWNDANDWSRGNIPQSSDSLIFSQSVYGAANSGATIPNNALNSPFTIRTLAFDTGTDSFGIDAYSQISAALALSFNGGPDNGFGTNDHIYLSATTTGTITIGRTASQGSLTLAFGSGGARINVVNAAATLALGPSSVVSGSNGLTKSGSGTLVFGGTSAYTGDTLVSFGTLAVTGTLSTLNNDFTVDGSATNAPAGSLSGTGLLSASNAFHIHQ